MTEVREDGPKRVIAAVVVKVLHHCQEQRGMILEPFSSRCVRRGEVHELVTTDQPDASCGTRVDRVGFLGFVEIVRAGVVDRGDEVQIDRVAIGTVAGFDACHYPNHYNIVILSEALRSGLSLGLQPEASVRFVQPTDTAADRANTVASPRPCSHPSSLTETEGGGRGHIFDTDA